MNKYINYKRDYPDEYKRLQQPYECGCGNKIKLCSLLGHIKSKKHQSFIEKKGIHWELDKSNSYRIMFPQGQGKYCDDIHNSKVRMYS